MTKKKNREQKLKRYEELCNQIPQLPKLFDGKTNLRCVKEIVNIVHNDKDVDRTEDSKSCKTAEAKKS
jgi:hypothetical protein